MSICFFLLKILVHKMYIMELSRICISEFVYLEWFAL